MDELEPTPPEPPAGTGDVPPPAPVRRISAVADGVERPVDPNWVGATRLTSSIAAFAVAVPALGGGLVAAFFADRLGALGGAAVTVAEVVLVAFLGWSALALPALRYRHLRYRVDADGLAIRRGVWWREDVRVPRSRVQHTDVTQGPVERSFGLATLVVHTAGTQHARISLEGLREGTARAIRDHLVDAGEDDGV